MSKYEVTDAVPIPAKGPRGNGKTYPFDTMEVGQSFHIADGDMKPHSLATLVGYANRNFTPRYFVSRREGEGRRFWRVR